MAISAVFAPATAFLIWSTLAVFPPDHPLDVMAFGLYPLIFAVVNGVLPAFVIGGALAWVFERRSQKTQVLAALAGATAASLYGGSTYGLAALGMERVAHVAVWATLLADKPQPALAIVLVIAAIVTSGALAALVYVTVARR